MGEDKVSHPHRYVDCLEILVSTGVPESPTAAITYNRVYSPVIADQCADEEVFQKFPAWLEMSDHLGGAISRWYRAVMDDRLHKGATVRLRRTVVRESCTLGHRCRPVDHPWEDDSRRHFVATFDGTLWTINGRLRERKELSRRRKRQSQRARKKRK